MCVFSFTSFPYKAVMAVAGGYLVAHTGHFKTRPTLNTSRQASSKWFRVDQISDAIVTPFVYVAYNQVGGHTHWALARKRTMSAKNSDQMR